MNIRKTQDTQNLRAERKPATTWPEGLFAYISSTCGSSYVLALTGATGRAEVRLLMPISHRGITYICNNFVFDLAKFSLRHWVFHIPAVKVGDDAHPLRILVRVDEPPGIVDPS